MKFMFPLNGAREDSRATKWNREWFMVSMRFSSWEVAAFHEPFPFATGLLVRQQVAKAAEGCRTPRPGGALKPSTARQLLECGSPLPLFSRFACGCTGKHGAAFVFLIPLNCQEGLELAVLDSHN